MSRSSSHSTTSNILGALSHFFYHYSGGQYLLCDLQGCSDDSGIILSDCVINSTAARRHGPSDLGPDGISTFFRCGRLFFKPQTLNVTRRLQPACVRFLLQPDLAQARPHGQVPSGGLRNQHDYGCRLRQQMRHSHGYTLRA